MAKPHAKPWATARPEGRCAGQPWPAPRPRARRKQKVCDGRRRLRYAQAVNTSSFVTIDRLIRTGNIEPAGADRVQFLWNEIARLKREKRAFIPAHNYQVPEVQAVADYVGD